MQYINTKDNKYVIEYDTNTMKSRILSVEEVERQGAEAEAKLQKISLIPPDKELLAWAKANYPVGENLKIVKSLEEKVELAEAVELINQK